MTSLGYISLSLIAETQRRPLKSALGRLKYRMEALEFQETRYGRKTKINRVPGLINAAAISATNVPWMQNFIDGRLFPVLPQNLADLLEKTAAQL